MNFPVFLFAPLIFASIQAPAYAATSCENLLSSASANLQSDATDKLIAYLSALLENHLIGDAELLRMIDGSDNGKLSNPISEEQTWISSNALIHREEIQKYLGTTSLDQKRLLEWSKKYLKEKERVKNRREVTREETDDLNEKIEFNPVRPGTFQVGVRTKTTINLTHPFEMMSTAITQKQWVELMGENPSHFVDGEEAITVTVQGKAIKMLPNNPVEQVTWWSVVEYANRMSVKKGLKPAYDLSGVKFKAGTRAENGTLDAVWEHSFGKSVKINAIGGDIYQAEGFRLPTEAESMYMRRAAGKSNGTYHFGENEEDLKDYAWYISNSDRQTHPVGLLRPITVAGRQFYDLLGNIDEWNHDFYADQFNGGDNPKGANSGDCHVINGGSYASRSTALQSMNRGHFGSGNRREYAGFRLVRTTNIIPEDKP